MEGGGNSGVRTIMGVEAIVGVGVEAIVGVGGSQLLRTALYTIRISISPQNNLS